MKQIVTMLAVFCLTQTAAAADVFVKCFNHKGTSIFNGVLSDRYLNTNVSGGVIITGYSRIGRGYSVGVDQALKLGFQKTANCKVPFMKIFEAISENVTLVCATAEMTDLMTHLPSDAMKDLNQRSVLERLSDRPECTIVTSSDKMDLIRAIAQ